MKDFFKDYLVPGVGVITGLLAAWVSYSVSDVKSKLDLQKGQLDAQQASLTALTTERTLKKFDEDLTFRIYEAVTASLKAKDAQQQQAASALVIVLATEPLRTQLLHVFEQSELTAPTVKKEVGQVLNREQQFQQEEATVTSAAPNSPALAPQSGSRRSRVDASAPGSGWGQWDVDVFWCQRSGDAARGMSESIVEALEREGAKGRLRSRMLPDSINARSGYQVSGFLIRPDAGDTGEEERARALLQLAEHTLTGTAFRIAPSASATRWYLSVFICP